MRIVVDEFTIGMGGQRPAIAASLPITALSPADEKQWDAITVAALKPEGKFPWLGVVIGVSAAIGIAMVKKRQSK